MSHLKSVKNYKGVLFDREAKLFYDILQRIIKPAGWNVPILTFCYVKLRFRKYFYLTHICFYAPNFGCNIFTSFFSSASMSSSPNKQHVSKSHWQLT